MNIAVPGIQIEGKEMEKKIRRPADRNKTTLGKRKGSTNNHTRLGCNSQAIGASREHHWL